MASDSFRQGVTQTDRSSRHGQRNRAARAVGAILALICAFFVPDRPASAQPSEKVVRIGFLLAGSVPSPGIFIDDFQEVLREHGWVEGRNIRFDYRSADGRYDRLPALAAELVPSE